MKYIFAIILTISSLYSVNIKDLGDIGALKEKLEKMKQTPQDTKIKPKKIVVRNIINTQNIKNIPTQHKSEKMKKSIFQYRDDNSIIRERDSAHLKIETGSIVRFGDSFFQNRNRVEQNRMPIPRNYRINKGDIISIWIYGAKNRNTKLEVDRNGNINVDGVGPLYVYNLRFSSLKKMLITKYTTIYKNVKLHIDLDRTTPIQITIAGEVNSPGIYNIPSFSTIKEALIESKGISPYGSYRDIKLIRNGRVIKIFDLYRLIRKGDQSYLNYILKNGDGIIVNRSKKSIIIKGSIKMSGIYELKKDENIKSLINYAGGLKIEASNTIAKLERVDNHKKRVVIDIKLSKTVPLKNGDIITIIPVNMKNSDNIYIYGNVVRVGERGFHKGLTLYNLLKKEISINGIENFFLKNVEMDYSVIRRYSKTTFREEIVQFSLTEVLSGKKDIHLMKGDEVYIFNKVEFKENPYIYINGKVITNSGKYQYFSNMKLADIQKITKFKTELIVDGKRRVIQVSKKIKLLRNIRDNLEIHFLNLDTDKDFEILEFDEITFFDQLEREAPKFAIIYGEVLSAGKYRIDENTDINKLIELAKGLKKEAYLNRFEVIRYSIVNGEREYKIIEKSLQDAIDQKFKIEEFDKITIFRIPKWDKQENIKIYGEVKFPGIYTIQKGDTLSKIVKRAGGYLDTAFFDGAIFTRSSIQDLQKQRLQESIRKLKQDSLYLISSPTSTGEQSGDKTMLIAMIDSLITELSEFEPNGRVSLKLNRDSNFILEDGDQIYVPTVNETVTVIGEVLNPNSFFFEDNFQVENYLEKSGGLNSKADIDNIYIVHPNGEAERYEQSYLFGSNSTIRTGDTIIVPIKILTSSYTGVTKDIAQIIYQFAITAISLKTIGVF